MARCTHVRGRAIVALVIAGSMAACGGPGATPGSSPGTSPVTSPNPSVTIPASMSPGPSPAPSPTVPASARIAVVVGQPDATRIIVMSAAAGDPGDAVGSGAGPAWSPDGRQIAFICRYDPDQMPGLCVVEPDSPDAVPALVMPGVVSVTWSPAGDWLAIGRSAIDFGDTWLVRPDGTGLREVGLRDHETRVDLWSPDGARIAGAASFGGASAPVVAVCEVESGACGVMGGGSAEAWAPGGPRLAVIGGSVASVNASVLDLGTGERLPLVDLVPSVTAVAWARTGMLAAVGEDGGLVILDGPGAVPETIAEDLRVTGRPAWSPDGDWLAVRAESGQGSDIFVMRPDGTDRRQLATGGAGQSVVWAPAP